MSDGYKKSSDYAEFKQFQNSKSVKKGNYTGFYIFLLYTIFIGSTIYAKFNLTWEMWLALGYALAIFVYFIINSGERNEKF